MSDVKPDRVQIYLTDGKLGRHAGVYHSARTWAAHPSDDATAAFRVAVKFWFGKGANSAWTYGNISRVVVGHVAGSTWKAELIPVSSSTPLEPDPQPRRAGALKRVRRRVRPSSHKPRPPRPRRAARGRAKQFPKERMTL